ncbi:MAG TPA: 30S ribosomal protein S3ae [Candidatus Thermoplasmatota archaeon]|nr:30S ribosomal protein S3ae [Candidatus Thermoplasmatota archaeon]
MAQDKGEEKGKKKAVQRSSTRKVKDKWKSKQWYTIKAPKMFNAVAIAETLADDTPKLLGRVAEATLQDLTGDFSKMHIKVYFKVNGVAGTDCGTKFVGHELTSDYVRRLTRRKHSKIDHVVDATTKDGFTIRVKPFAVTEKRAKTTQEQDIRRIATKIVQDSAQGRSMPEFVRDVVNGELGQAIFKEARKVYPLKRVEIRKSEVRREPEGYVEDVEVFAAPAPTNGDAAPADEEVVEDISASLEEGVEVKAEEELTEEERVQ